ncbi:hypothetical protein Y032_0013g2170 [Ancylostoma ceylanicum]|nr:hypothetical protein Y032_0013g2170 [Ancylostoma ceylanicum]
MLYVSSSPSVAKTNTQLPEKITSSSLATTKPNDDTSLMFFTASPSPMLGSKEATSPRPLTSGSPAIMESSKVTLPALPTPVPSVMPKTSVSSAIQSLSKASHTKRTMTSFAATFLSNVETLPKMYISSSPSVAKTKTHSPEEITSSSAATTEPNDNTSFLTLSASLSSTLGSSEAMPSQLLSSASSGMQKSSETTSTKKTPLRSTKKFEPSGVTLPTKHSSSSPVVVGSDESRAEKITSISGATLKSIDATVSKMFTSRSSSMVESSEAPHPELLTSLSPVTQNPRESKPTEKISSSPPVALEATDVASRGTFTSESDAFRKTNPSRTMFPHDVQKNTKHSSATTRNDRHVPTAITDSSRSEEKLADLILTTSLHSTTRCTPTTETTDSKSMITYSAAVEQEDEPETYLSRETLQTLSTPSVKHPEKSSTPGMLLSSLSKQVTSQEEVDLATTHETSGDTKHSSQAFNSVVEFGATQTATEEGEAANEATKTNIWSPPYVNIEQDEMTTSHHTRSSYSHLFSDEKKTTSHSLPTKKLERSTLETKHWRSTPRISFMGSHLAYSIRTSSLLSGSTVPATIMPEILNAENSSTAAFTVVSKRSSWKEYRGFSSTAYQVNSIVSNSIVSLSMNFDGTFSTNHSRTQLHSTEHALSKELSTSKH